MRALDCPKKDLPPCRPTCRGAARYPCRCLAAEAAADLGEAIRFLHLARRPGVKKHLGHLVEEAKARRNSEKARTTKST